MPPRRGTAKYLMRIGSDISSLGVINRLNQTNRALSRALERLSTGKRVNSPADDSVSFSMGINLDAQTRGLRQAVRNINDSKSMLMVADSALESQAEILQRMRELAVQASNGTLNSDQRDALQTELNSLLDEFARITDSTKFGDLHVLEGINIQDFVQVGANFGESLNVEIDSSEKEGVFTKTEGTGRFTLDWEEDLSVGGGGGIASGDVDGDGDLDFVRVDEGVVGTYKNDGEGNFSLASTSYEVAPDIDTFRSGALVDTNGDGILDLVSVASQTVYHFLGNGDGTFDFTSSTIATKAFGANTKIETGDFNNDGNIDLAMASEFDSVLVFQGSGSGTFTQTATLGQIAIQSASKIALGDFNGDGNLDIASRFDNDSLYLWYGAGNGAFNNHQTITLGLAFAPTGVTAGDIDNDGDLDLIAGNGLQLSHSVLLNNGSGNFTVVRTIQETVFSASTGYSELIDINRDGYLDLIAADVQGSIAAVRFGDGTGRFTLQSTIEITGQIIDELVGDFNGDGVTDIIYSKSGANTSALYSQTTEGTAVGDLNFTTQAKSQIALEVIDNAIAHITENRATIGSLHNRLEITASAQLLASESMEEAKSKATDADIAEETAELVRNQILQQAQVAVLAQANLNMQTVLGLLRN